MSVECPKRIDGTLSICDGEPKNGFWLLDGSLISDLLTIQEWGLKFTEPEPPREFQRFSRGNVHPSTLFFFFYLSSIFLSFKYFCYRGKTTVQIRPCNWRSLKTPDTRDALINFLEIQSAGRRLPPTGNVRRKNAKNSGGPDESIMRPLAGLLLPSSRFVFRRVPSALAARRPPR